MVQDREAVAHARTQHTKGGPYRHLRNARGGSCRKGPDLPKPAALSTPVDAEADSACPYCVHSHLIELVAHRVADLEGEQRASQGHTEEGAQPC